MTIRGMGFWPSDQIKVRFVPMVKKPGMLGDEDSASVVGNPVDQEGDGVAEPEDAAVEGTDELDAGSVSSDSSSESSGGARDPRCIEEVRGWFDPASGGIKCIVPPSEAIGVVLVQVAMDGRTYTSDDIYYDYAQPCELMRSEPKAQCCTMDEPERMMRITCYGKSLADRPELCIRLTCDGRTYCAPAQLVRPEQPPLPEGTAESEDAEAGQENKDDVSGAPVPVGQQMVVADVNVNEVFSALRGKGDSEVLQVKIDVSLNGQDFPAVPAELQEECQLTISRLAVRDCSPNAWPLVSDNVLAKQLVGAVMTLRCTGLAQLGAGEEGPEGSIMVRLCLRGNSSGNSLEGTSCVYQCPGQMDLAAGSVMFAAPQLASSELMQNGQGWGTCHAQVQLSIDGGSTWARCPEPLVFYAGTFADPQPVLVPVGAPRLCLPVRHDQLGWLFEGCDPLVELRIGGGSSGWLEVTSPVTVSRSEDGCALECALPDLSSAYSGVLESRKAKLRDTAVATYWAEHPLEEDANEEATAHAEAQAAAHGDAAVEEVWQDPCELELLVKVNREVESWRFDKFRLFEHPSIDALRPDQAEVGAAQQAGEEEAAAIDNSDGSPDGVEGEASVAPPPTCELTLVSDSVVPTDSHPIVRFSFGDKSIDVPGTFKPLPTPEELEELAKAKQAAAKKKGGKKDSIVPPGADQPASELPDSNKRRTLVCELPRLSEPGDYQVEVAVNGVDFGPSQAVLQVVALPDEGAAEAAE